MSENSRLATVEQYKHFKEIWRDNWNEALGLMLHPHWGVKMGQIAIVMPLALSSSSHLSPLLWQWSKKGLRYIQVTATAEMMSKFSKVKSHFHSKEQSEISFAKNDLIDFEGECLAQLSCQTQWHKYKFSYGMTFPPSSGIVATTIKTQSQKTCVLLENVYALGSSMSTYRKLSWRKTKRVPKDICKRVCMEH